MMSLHELIGCVSEPLWSDINAIIFAQFLSLYVICNFICIFNSFVFVFVLYLYWVWFHDYNHPDHDSESIKLASCSGSFHINVDDDDDDDS